MSRGKLITLIILVIICVIIVLQNTQPVETRLLFFTLTMPRAVLLVGTTLLGFALGVLVTFLTVRKSAKQKKQKSLYDSR